MSYHRHVWPIVRKGRKRYKHTLSSEGFATFKLALNDFEAKLQASPGGWRKALKRAEDLREGNAYVSNPGRPSR